MALRRAPAAALLWIVFVTVLSATDVIAQDEVVNRRDPTGRVVVLDDTACRGVSPTELRELSTLELAPRVVVWPSDAGDAPDTTRVLLRCDADSARIVVNEAARPDQELVLELSSIAVPARARLIALSLSELLATADMEPIARAPEPHEDQEVLSQPGPSRPSHVWVGAGLAREGRPSLLAPSLQTGLALNVAGLPLALVLELEAQRGEHDVAAGRVTLWTTSASMGPAAQLRVGPLDLSLGVGARLGYARLIGEADQAPVTGHVVSGLWWGPTLGASATWRLGARVGVRAGVDLTWIARAVRGTDSTSATAYELEGLMVQATLGARFSLPTLRIGRRQPSL